MLEELIDCTDSDRFEHYGHLQLKSVTRDDKSLLLHLILTCDDVDPPEDQAWEIACNEVVRDQLSFGRLYSVDHVAEHPLLWEFTDPQVTLYFAGSPSDPRAVVGALALRHQLVTEAWIPFGRHMNEAFRQLDQLLTTGSGMLAKGPDRLLAAYAKVLEEFGLRPSSVRHNRPNRQTDWGLGPDESAPSLLRLDDSYVIAQDIRATKVEGPISV